MCYLYYEDSPEEGVESVWATLNVIPQNGKSECFDVYGAVYMEGGRSWDWKKYRSEDFDLVHQTHSANRSVTMFDVGERLWT